MSKKPKTQGLEWLVHSLTAFNGSGYADMNSPEDFLHSYIIYKDMRNKPQAVNLAKLFKQEALYVLEDLLDKTYGASRKPSDKSIARFEAHKKKQQGHLL